MASALLASSRNEPFWGEQKVYMRKNPNPNPRPVQENSSKDRPRATSVPSPFVDRIDHATGANEPLPAAFAAAPAVSEDSSSFNHHQPSGLPGSQQHYLQRPLREEPSFGGAYVTINIAAYSRRELQELKRRLISELEQVRCLSSRIDSGDLQIARSTCFSASSNGGGGGSGREVSSAAAAARHPPALLNQSMALDSPPVVAGSDRRAPLGGNHYIQLPVESVSGRDTVGASLHPGDNHKKLAKRALPLTSPRKVKRQATTAESDDLMTGMMRKCGQILTKLMKHKNAWVFNTPVDVVGLRLHDYYQIIKRPMDLGTVKSQLEKNFYPSPTEFAADIRLTFNNALLYNPDGHTVHKMAKQFLNLFEKLFAEAHKAYNKEKRAHAPKTCRGEEENKKSSVRMPPEAPPGRASPARPSNLFPESSSAPPTVPVPTPPPPRRSPSPVPLASVQMVAPPSKPQPPPLSPTSRPAVGKQPKPKAKEPNKREMSFEEKRKLSLGLQSLPQEKMAQVLQIVQRRNPDPAMHGDEIELDFEVLNTETLWELDRFVCNCKKMISKIKRQEAMLAAAPAAAEVKGDDSVVKTNQVPAMETPEPASYEKKGKKAGEPGDEEVDIGEDVPSSHFPPVEIEKDVGYHSESSSSSSSSSDSSSSGDTDSRSSSESDSDADDAQSPAVG